MRDAGAWRPPPLPSSRISSSSAGGHSHIAVLKKFGMQPVPGVRLTLICREVHTPYSGMLPGLIARHYAYDEAHIDLRKLAVFASARFICAEVTGLDPEIRELRFANRPPIPYDLLSLNTGSTPGMHRVPGADEFRRAGQADFAFLATLGGALSRARRARRDAAYRRCRRWSGRRRTHSGDATQIEELAGQAGEASGDRDSISLAQRIESCPPTTRECVANSVASLPSAE